MEALHQRFPTACRPPPVIAEAVWAELILPMDSPEMEKTRWDRVILTRLTGCVDERCVSSAPGFCGNHADGLRGGAVMTPTGHFDLSTQQLDALALEFLGSEFTTQFHIDWPIERCVDAYLMHHGLTEVINDGAACNALLERVMANIGPAIRKGLLTPPRIWQ